MLLIAGGIYAWVHYQPAQRAETARRPSAADVAPPLEGIIELTDISGRSLRCEVIAKRGEHLQVRREADGRSFLLKLETLDAPSRQRLAKVADFKTKELEAAAFDLAKASLKVELLAVPALCTFRCPKNGRMLTSQEGYELESFREFLNAEGIGYRDVALDVKIIDNAYYLPPEVPKLPCIRIGSTLVPDMSRTALKAALVATYLGGN